MIPSVTTGFSKRELMPKKGDSQKHHAKHHHIGASLPLPNHSFSVFTGHMHAAFRSHVHSVLIIK